jgi:hypothetical protein
VAHTQALIREACPVALKQLLVDGRPDGLSGEIFETAAELRTRADTCWLDAPSACAARGGAESSTDGARSCRLCGFVAPRPDAARALGHLVNHMPDGMAANVVFRLVPLPADVPPALLDLLPCIHAGGLQPTPRWVRAQSWLMRHRSADVCSVLLRFFSALQVVEVRASRALSVGEELYADYGKDPSSLGYLG